MSYYETHIVVKPPFHLERVSTIAKNHGFWTSQITQDGSEEESAGDLLLTTRDASQAIAETRIRDLVVALRYSKHASNVARYKIERCVIDSKVTDSLKLKEWMNLDGSAADVVNGATALTPKT